MELKQTSRGFDWIEHPAYSIGEVKRLASQSSAIGDYDDSLDRPGSSFLWIGESHHLNREEVAEFVKYLQAWLKTGSMKR